MKKNIKKIVCVVLLTSLLLGGCRQENDNTTEKVNEEQVTEISYNVPAIDSDYFKIYANDADFTYSDYSVCNTMIFTMIAGDKIDESQLKVEMNGGIDCEYSIGESEDEVMPEVVLEIYNKGTDISKLSSEFDSFSDKLPKLYEYKLCVEPVDFNSEEASELIVSYAGKKYKYDISVKYNHLDLLLDDKEQLSCSTLARTDLNAEYYIDGKFNVGNLKFSANNDIELKDIYFVGSDKTVIDEIEIESNGVNYVWDKSNSDLFYKGSEVTMSIMCYDETIKKFTSCNRYLVLKYLCDGKEYETYVEIQLRVRLDRYEMFAMDDESVDYKSEYIRYNNK